MNNWEGIDVWQAGSRSARTRARAGPTTRRTARAASRTALQQHRAGNTTSPMKATRPWRGYLPGAARPVAGSSTILVAGASAIDDQIGFGDPASTKTTAQTNVATFTGSGTISASSAGFPSSGELRVGTSAAWSEGGGSYTGAILSYTGTTPTTFTGVSLVRGPGRWQARSRKSSPTKSLPRSATPMTAPSRSLRVWPARRRPEPMSAMPAPASSTPLARLSPRGPSLLTASPTGTGASGKRRTSP